MKATQEEIASATGLSEREVERGLEVLRAKDLIVPVGSACRSGFLLTPPALAGSESY